MRRTMLPAVTLLLCFAFVAPMAAGADENATQMRTIQSVKVDRAPRLEELRKLALPAPTGVGTERQVPNILVPERLKQAPRKKTTGQSQGAASQSAPSAIVGNAPTANLSFGGYDSDDNANMFGFRIMPPDTNGDVGLENYVQFNNLGFKIYDKSGNLLNGPDGDPGNLPWAGFGGTCETENNGDPIVLYDEQAGRWLFSQFEVAVNGLQCVAISDGEDPAGPYTRYAFPISLAGFNDYPKIGVWTSADGSQSAYHITTNEFDAAFLGVNLTALDRDAMLAGGTAGFVQFTILPDDNVDRFAFSLQPGHLEGSALPPAGTCETYIQVFDTETWGNIGDTDGYRTWSFCVDFDMPANSTLTENVLVPAGIDFDSNLCDFGPCVPQPNGQLLDTLSQFTMYRFAVRDVNGALSGVITHNVDVRTNQAGVQWAQFDMSGAAPSLSDIGQLKLRDRMHRWMASSSQDQNGNIAIGYSRSGAGSSEFPSVYFTGRESTDPAGSLQDESVCIDGSGSQSGGSRWGDYSSVSIDPADDCTFWITNEYVETTGTFQWDTQVCTFSFPSCGDGGGGGGTDPDAPSAPSDLVATGGRERSGRISIFFVDLSWTDNSSGVGQETEFVIERTIQTGSRRDRQCGTFAEVASVAADETSYLDNNLARGTTYCYQVRGRNALGDGDASDVVTVRPR